MLARLSMPTNPAATAAVIAELPPLRKKSWIMGAACSRMPIPAVTLQNNTIHNSQNWRVLIASFARTSAPFRPGWWATVSSCPPYPCGNLISATPIIMKIR